MKNSHSYNKQQLVQDLRKSHDSLGSSDEDCDFGDTDECIVSAQAQNALASLGQQQRSQTPQYVNNGNQIAQAKSPQLQNQNNSSKRTNNHQQSVLVPSSSTKKNDFDSTNNQQAYYTTTTNNNNRQMQQSKSQLNFYATQNFQTTSKISSQQRQDDPECRPDFSSAYLKLVQKVYEEQGTNILITQDELNRLAYTQQILSVQDFQVRNQQMLENKQQKVKMMEEIKKTAEMQECTFKPQIYTKHSKDRRNFDQFLKDQAQFDDQKKQKALQRQEQTQALKNQELKYQPQVNKKSAKIVEQKKKIENNGTQVYERLHVKHQEKIQKNMQKVIEMTNQERQMRNGVGSRNLKKTKSEVNFLSARSKERESGKTIDDMLYEDAKRRWEKQELKKRALTKLKDEQIQSTKPPSGINNLKYAASKFEKEFYFAVYTVIGEPIDENSPQEIDVKDYDDKRLNYVKIGQLMSEMGYIPANVAPDSVERELLFDMWNLLQGEENSGISVVNIKKLLLAVQGISLDAILQNNERQSQHKNEERTSQIQLNDYDDNGVLKITQQETNKLFLKFKALYVNRVQFIGTQKRIRYVDNSCTFRPQISKTTEQLAQQKRIRMLSEHRSDNRDDQSEHHKTMSMIEAPKVDIVSILLHPVNSDNQWKQSAKQILQAKELEECTFKPKILNYESNRVSSQSQLGRSDKCAELYNKAKFLKDKKDKTQEEYEFEKAQNQCTFQPNIEESQKAMELIYFSQKDQADSMYLGGGLSDNGDPTQHIKGYQLAMARLKKGREERERANLMLGRGIPGTELDEAKLQPMQVHSNSSYKGVFSSYSHEPSTAHQSQSNRPQMSQQTSGQYKLANSKSTDGLFKVNNNAHNRRQSYNRVGAIKHTNNHKRQEKENINSNQRQQTQVSKSFIIQQNDNQKQNRPANKVKQNAQSRYSDYNRNNQNNDYSYESEEKRLTGGSILNGILSDVQSDVDVCSSHKSKPLSLYQKQPLLYVDVNLGPGKSERIIVFDGDTSDSLAEKFANSHGLDNNMKGKLAQLLESQIAGLLEKIEEEQNSVHSDNINA